MVGSGLPLFKETFMFKALLLVLAFIAAPALAITTDEVELLNNRFSPSVAHKVQLGTLISDATTVVTGDVTDDSLLIGDFNETVMAETTVTLSAANIAAMNATPVTLIAAQGAGTVIIVDTIEFFHDYATAAYADGGDVTIEYETSGVDINVFDVALVTAGADDNWFVRVTIPYVSAAGTASNFSLTSSANKAVQITNATGAFTGGNASNIIKMKIRYRVVTLLT